MADPAFCILAKRAAFGIADVAGARGKNGPSMHAADQPFARQFVEVAADRLDGHAEMPGEAVGADLAVAAEKGHDLGGSECGRHSKLSENVRFIKLA